MILEVIIENDASQVPSQDDLKSWADEFGLTMPVLADEESILYEYASGGSVGLPYTVVLDRGVVIDTIMAGANSSRAEELL
jgi:hypothetical protein